MSRRLEFRCGHMQPFEERMTSPVCATCGTSIVARVHGIGPPRIVGCASGPYVETKALDAIAVRLATPQEPHGQ
jgi:hypothetical protein